MGPTAGRRLAAAARVIERHGLNAKNPGPEFPVDLNLTLRSRLSISVIARSSRLGWPRRLTRALLMEGAKHVIIERVLRCLPAFEEIAARVRVV